MTDAMEVLYSYAQDYLARPLLALEPDYADAQREAKKQTEAVLAILNDGGQELLDDLLDGQNHLSSFYSRALFRAGFQLAMELAGK